MVIRKESRVTFVTCAVVLASLLGCWELHADSILGSVHFGGSWTARDSDGNTTSIGSATEVDVKHDRAQVTSVGGDFADYLSVDEWVAYSDFQIDPFSSSGALWSGGGFQFNLTSTHVDTQTDSLLSMRGTGIVSGNGFDNTIYSWSFQGSEKNQRWNIFSNSLPEPSTALSLLVGLLGIGIAVRRHRLEI